MVEKFLNSNTETEPSVEKEKKHIASRILIEVRRHGEKPSKEMEAVDVEITPQSKKEIVERAHEFGPPDRKDMQQAIAFGAGNVRTETTAGLMMGGIDDEITGDEPLEELKEKLGQETNEKGKVVRTKLSSKKFLNFVFSDSELDQALQEATSKGEWIKFIIEKSDVMARKLQDGSSLTYTRIAAKLAEAFLKYADQGIKRWDQLVNDEGKKYAPTLERYWSAPAAITAFLANIIERIRGIKERDAFAESLKEGHLDYLEGYRVEILIPEDGNSENPQIKISYFGDGYSFNETITKELLQGIVKDGIKFEEEVNGKKS